VWFVSGWQVKLCDLLVTHQPYLSASETGHYKALYRMRFAFFTLLLLLLRTLTRSWGDTLTDLVAVIFVEQNQSDCSDDYTAKHNGSVGERLPQLGVPFSSTVTFEPQTAFHAQTSSVHPGLYNVPFICLIITQADLN